MIRRPLRPLARILAARADGHDPDEIEAEERAARLAEMHRAERKKAEVRLLLLACVFILGFSTIAGRMALVSAQGIEADAMAANSAQIAESRADITDRNGRILATTTYVSSLYVKPGALVHPEKTARELLEIFPDLTAKRLAHLFAGDSGNKQVVAQISPEQKQQVYALGEPGLFFGRRLARIYPNGPVAAHILGGTRYGLTAVDGAEILGIAGVEYTMNARLRDAEAANRPLALTLDLDAQIALEQVLEEGVAQMQALHGAAVLMDVETGAIRAMASYPDFDPNNRPPLPDEDDAAASPLFNFAAQGGYELGSVFKPLAVAQVLDLGLVGPNTLVDTNGPLRVGGHKIRDYHNYGPHLSVIDVVVKSSNIGTARLAQAIGPQKQRAFLDALGMLSPLDVELPEARSSHPQIPGNWSEGASMTISYGHGVAVTPLHLASAYATLANGGRRVKPTLLEASAAPSGDQVISRRAAYEVTSMLREVVKRGTGIKADLRGFEIGGKTGTADKPKPGGGYYKKRVISSFASIFPASSPKYALIVTLDEPRNVVNGNTIRTATWTAAPLAAKIVARVAAVMGIRPDYAPSEPGEALYTLTGND